MDARSRFLLSTWLVAAVSLQGCGGSGGSSGPPPNRPPTASFTATPATGPPPLAVTLDASASRDSDGSITACAWDFGDGSTGTGRTVDYTYENSGAFEVRLTVTDDDGAQASAANDFVVNVPPSARILADPVDGVAPVTVTFDASESTDSDGEVASYEWEVADNATAGGATFEHTFEEPGVYPVRLTVTDDLGGVDEVVFEVNASVFEDVADLHDAILMSYHHGFEKDIGIVGTEGDTRAEAIVAWGQRGRMTDANVVDRLRLVIDEMYPGDVQALHGYLNGRPAPLPMRRGETWAANRVLEGGADFSSRGLPGVDPVSGAAGPEPLSFGTPSPRPELFGCLRLDGGIKAGLEDPLGRKAGSAVAPDAPTSIPDPAP